MLQFSLQGQEYIELNKLLKLMELAQSGGEANAAIVSEQVTVNGQMETQKRKKLRAGDLVKFLGKTIRITA